MTKNCQAMSLLLSMFTTLSLFSGCTRIIKSAELEDQATIKKISEEAIQSQTLRKVNPRKLAVIDFTATLGDQQSAVDMAHMASAHILKEFGYEVAAPEQVTGNSAHQAVTPESKTFFGIMATGLKCRMSLDSWVTDNPFSFTNYTCSLADVQKIIEALGVDGVLAFYADPRGDVVHNSGLILYTKGSGNEAEVSWKGRFKTKAYGIDRQVTLLDRMDLKHGANVDPHKNAPVFAGAFKVLVARMSMDLGN